MIKRVTFKIDCDLDVYFLALNTIHQHQLAFT